MTPAEAAKSGTEHGHQRAVILWCNQYSYKHGDPRLLLLFAIHNQGHGDKIRGAIATAEGVKAGVPDLMLPVPFTVFAGLFIEMKKPGEEKKKNGGRSEEQVKWHEQLEQNHYKVETCYSWQQAITVIAKYLGLPELYWKSTL